MTIQLKNIPSISNVSDALDRLGITCKWLSKGMVTNIYEPFYGLADTVMWGPTRKTDAIQEPSLSTWEEVKGFISNIKKQTSPTVYVSGSLTPSLDFVLLGGMSITYIATSNYKGIITNGLIRDYDDVQKVNIPIWSFGYGVMDSQGCMKVESVGKGCYVNGHFIAQNDLIVGDGSGVIAIDSQINEKVIALALEINKKEESILERVINGESLYKLVNKGGHI